MEHARGNLRQMFVGHFGVGLAAKKVAPRAPLGWLIAAPLLLDLLWPAFLLLGWESVIIRPGATLVTPFDFVSYPVSHSLIAAVGWGALAAALYRIVRSDNRGALVVGAAVVSHWFLDVLMHVPDLPLYPGGPKFGLSLWNSLPATLAAEAIVFLAGVWIYSRSTRATSRAGVVGYWAFVALLVVAYVGNLVGPPPETVAQVAGVTLLLWLFPFWSWAFDCRRTLVDG